MLEAQSSHFFFWFIGRNNLWKNIIAGYVLAEMAEEQEAGRKKRKKVEGKGKRTEEEVRKEEKNVTDSKSRYQGQGNPIKLDSYITRQSFCEHHFALLRTGLG